MPEYRYDTYNAQHPGAVQERLDQMAADGWHVHTANLAYSEFYVLWERNGAMARMAAAAEAQLAAAQPAGDPEPASTPQRLEKLLEEEAGSQD